MLIPKEDFISLFAFVQDKIQSEKYAALNAANSVEILGIKEQIQEVTKRLEARFDDCVAVDGIYAPRIIRRHWASYSEDVETEEYHRLNELYTNIRDINYKILQYYVHIYFTASLYCLSSLEESFLFR